MAIICNDATKLENGKGVYFNIDQETIDINDNLSDKGESTTLRIKCPIGGPYPRPGYVSIIIQDGVAVFGGIAGKLKISHQSDADVVELPLNSYLAFTNQLPIIAYNQNNYLKGHLLDAIDRSGAFNGALDPNLLDVDVIGDNQQFFPYNFDGPGNLQAFLEDISKSLPNNNTFSWYIAHSGEDSLLNFNTGTIARLKVIIDGTGNNAAPASLTVPGASGALCDDIFWQDDLIQERGVPAASLVTIIGRNGKNRPDNTTLSKNEYLNYKALDDQPAYPVLTTADSVISIEVEDGMTTTFYTIANGGLLIFDPNSPDPDPGKCYIRQEEAKAYFNLADIPEGAIIRILHLTRYVFYQLIDPTAKSLIAAAYLNASDGIIEHLIVDENIVSQEQAIQRAESAGESLFRIPISVSFSTYRTGWRSGQEFTYQFSPLNINEILTVQSAPRSLQEDGRILTKISATNVPLKTIEELNDELSNAVYFPKQPRLIQIGEETE